MFAYFNAGHPHTGTLLQALAARQLPTVAYVPGGLPDTVADGLLRTQQPVGLHRAPLRLDAVLAGCDIVACHGVATASAALAAGKPVLHLPGHLEQDMVLHRLRQHGLGAGVRRGAAPEQVADALAALLGDPGYPARAIAFACRYRSHSPDRSAKEAAAVCVGALPC